MRQKASHVAVQCTLHAASSFHSVVHTSHGAAQPPPAHIKSRSADKLVGAWPEIALIYGVITEFC